MLRFSSVSYRIGKKIILNDLSFHLKRGEICFVTGAAASGKTTLLRLATCQIKPDSGLIYTAGIPLFRYKKAPEILRRRISVVSKESEIFGSLSVSDNFRLQSLLLPVGKKEIKAVVELFELESVLNIEISTLSSDEKGRILIASSVLKNPSLLFLDNPFCFFSYKSLQKIYQRIAFLSAQGLTVVFTAEQVPDFASGAIEVAIG